MNDFYKKFVEYISNTGGKPTIDMFDEDWEPIGQQIRDGMFDEGIIEYDGSYIKLLEND